MSDVSMDDPREVEKANATRDQKIAAFLAVAHRRFKTSADCFSALRAAQLEDKKFRASDQWDAGIRRQREDDKRPCLTVNRFPQVIGQIADQQREFRPGIQVNPVDDGADVDTAEVFQGVIRNIENSSDAETVYETGCNDQRVMGLGFWRVLSQYSSEGGDALDQRIFEQELRLKRIRNAFTVYPDPACQEATFSDARYYFITEDVPRDEYRARWDKSKLVNASGKDFQGIGDVPQDWINEHAIRIAEYWYVEESAETISLIELPVYMDPTTGQQMPAQRVFVPLGDTRIKGATVLQSREVRRRKVKWAKINAVEILEGNGDLTAGQDWPGQWIPIVPVLGDEIDVDGKVDYRGVVRDAKDPQRIYNVQVSSLMEAVGLAPKAPYVVVEGQLEGYEHEWETANIKNYAYLTTKPMSIGGQLVPPPQRQNFEPAIQAIIMAVQQADNDIKATTGRHDASLGQRGPQESGRAIMARQSQDDKGSSGFLSNFARAVRFTGEILIDMIPRIYDAPRVQRIIGTDDKPKMVMLHAGQPPAETAEQLQARGIAGIYDVSAGRYDVTASVGPSYKSRRQESVDILTGAVEANQSLLPLIGDILFKNMDVPGSQEIAKRLQKMLPPQLQEKEPGQQEIPPQVQQQMQAMQQQLQQMGQQLQQAQMVIETKAHELAAQGQTKQMELVSRERIAALDAQSRERIAAITAQTALIQTQASLNAGRAEQQLQAEMALLQQKVDQTHEFAMAQHAQAAAADQALLAQQNGQPGDQAGRIGAEE